MTKKKVVLAFSGGLDTTFCAKYLTIEKGMEVHAALVDTGGISEEEKTRIEKRADLAGVDSFRVLERTNDYYQRIIRYLIYGNVLKNNTYPLSVSAERVYQAIALAEFAASINADAIAHGSTGAGNDQVRFDLAFGLLLPGTEIITPIRDLKLSRQQEIDYLKEAGIELDWTKAQYSINKGLWGTSVGGAETLTSDKPLPESAYPTPVTKTEPLEVTLQFTEGQLTGLNGTEMDPVSAINALEEMAAGYGIGRDVHVGDTIIGIKGRVGFEAAAPLVIIKAHHLLEKHTLSKWQLHWKQQLGDWYGMFLHESQYFEPVMRNIETFLEDTQKTVTGEVIVTLLPYRFSVDGIRSSFDLMQSSFGTYGEMNEKWTGEDVKGFTKVISTSLRLHRTVQQDNSKEG
ncbi:MAG: argininosuccinate synthase [Flavobacteriales bacterium]|nr:argininosuccinate synthase [Flavobacteriales bacterium]